MTASPTRDATDPVRPPAPATVGVLTVAGREASLAKLLRHLGPELRGGGPTELIVVNNSGAPARGAVDAVVRAAGLPASVDARVLDSPSNDLAVGRNVVLERRRHDLVVFVDDDEYPAPGWLDALLGARRAYGTAIVAGPVLPEFEGVGGGWRAHVDLHNGRHRRTGERMPFVGSCNVAFDASLTDPLRFDPAYGRSGGEDTDFFTRAVAAGHEIVWCAEAVVYEDIPAVKGTRRALLRRFVNQGANYRRIMTRRGHVRSGLAFGLRAAATVAVSVPVAGALAAVGHRRAGDWIKRAASNLGKLTGGSGSGYGAGRR